MKSLRSTLFSLLILAILSPQAVAESSQPNFIIIFADDLGYGDLGCFGHPTIRTPQLDEMAHQGQRWTNFYVAASVCTPSRAGLLTGRLPIRNGMCSDQRRVLFPNSGGGLPTTEITIASALKKSGYATAAVGKWHLGHLPEFLPTAHGFDAYFGIPYSNDMDRKKGSTDQFTLVENEDFNAFNVPLLRNTKIVEQPADQRTITKRYTEEAVGFIEKQQKVGHPYFLYLAHNLPHIPLFRSADFKDKSLAGIYGDVIEEIDWSVGQVLDAVKKDATAQTYVIFTSDNGPWLKFKTHGGNAGLLRDGKGSTWEGGMREPTVMWAHPQQLATGVVTDMGSSLDLLPTFANLAGAPLPDDRTYDGSDLGPVLDGSGASPRQNMFYYHGQQLYAVRHGDYKAHWKTKTSYAGQKQAELHDPPLLYNLSHDPSEKYNIAADHPEIIAKLETIAKAHTESIEPVTNQLEIPLSQN